MSSISKNFFKSNIIVTAMTLASVAVSFFSQMVIAYYFGASAERDAYFSAVVVPTYLIMLFSGSFTAVALPFYMEFKKKSDPAAVAKLIGSMLGLCTAMVIGVAIIGYFGADYIVSLIAPGFDAEQGHVTAKLFRVLIFSVIFQSLSSFLSVFHHVEGRFLLPAVIPIITPVVSVICVTLFSDYGITSLAVGTVLGSAIGVLVLLRMVFRRIDISHFFNFINNDTIALLKLSIPLFASGAVFRLTTVLERIIASELPSGSISYLGYANQMNLLMVGIATGSIATTFYPLMSGAWADGNQTTLNDYVSRGVRLILFLTLPIASLISALAYPMIKILFERGLFDSQATAAISRALTVLVGAFIFGSLGSVIAKIFYITKKTTAVSVISTIEVFAYLVIGYLLSLKFSYLGLAAALSLSAGLNILLSITVLSKWKLVSFTGLYLDVFKLLVAALVCGLTAYFSYVALDFLNVNMFIATVMSGLISIVVYVVIVLYVLKVRDSSIIVNMLRNIFDGLRAFM